MRIEPSTGLNVLVGENGAGKTSVLEAMMILAKGRSFRSGQAASLIGPHEPHFLINAEVCDADGSTIRLGLERTTDGWRARRNGEDCRNIGELAADLPLVLLEPNSHELVSGAPDGRRRYLDWSLFHVEHDYLDVWRRYSRAIKQRNAALRNGDRRTVSSLDPQVARLGETIDQRRQQRADAVAKTVPEKLGELGSALPDVQFNYRRGWSGEDLLESLKLALERDLDRGATGPGPHRADLVIRSGDSLGRDSLSRGEQKLVAAALLLAQADAIVSTGTAPIFLLDDLASEFDARHFNRVLDACLAFGGQTWLTGTSWSAESTPAASGARMFHVERGDIRPAPSPEGSA